MQGAIIDGSVKSPISDESVQSANPAEAGPLAAGQRNAVIGL
jgi:hypothetical protein